MKELSLTQSQWLALDYYDRVEWCAYFLNENKKQVALEVDRIAASKKEGK